MLQKNFDNSPLSSKIVIRLDDIAPNMNWDMMNRTKQLFDKHNVKPIIGVIPKNEDKELIAYSKCSFNFWDEIKNLQNKNWEIAMHGYQHLYDKTCKNDYLKHGGNTEFAGLSYEEQFERLRLGLEIFKKNSIKVESFFAPNHTFDQNTIKACKELGFKSIIDGYGIAPYNENGLIFFPQLFYRLYIMPFGFQTIQLHLNYMIDQDFLNLKKFIEKNEKKIITLSQAKSLTRNTFFYNITKYLIKRVLILRRAVL
tara:strand:+ start:144 stop:908 length:765 start_codon:yes stop_codon:yes gene_type:complete